MRLLLTRKQHDKLLDNYVSLDNEGFADFFGNNRLNIIQYLMSKYDHCWMLDGITFYEVSTSDHAGTMLYLIIKC